MAVTEEQQVLALITKRLRALRKKNNKIKAMEESMSQGKTLNKEQKETILSKPIVTALIEELEKLRLPPPPPSAAVTEEQRKETAEEEKVTDMEDCKISDGLNDNDDGEVSKDNTSPATQSPTSVSNGKPRRKRKSKKPQTTST